MPKMVCVRFVANIKRHFILRLSTCPHKYTHTLIHTLTHALTHTLTLTLTHTHTLTHTLTNCVNALTGPQPREQDASGSVNGDNAAQPAANAVAGMDRSASAHAIQVRTISATFMHCFAYSHACISHSPERTSPDAMTIVIPSIFHTAFAHS